MGKWRTWLCATVLAGFVTDTAAGQAIDRPADERPQLEQFEIEGLPEPSLELPRPPPPPPGADRLMAGLTVFLQEAPGTFTAQPRFPRPIGEVPATSASKVNRMSLDVWSYRSARMPTRRW